MPSVRFALRLSSFLVLLPLGALLAQQLPPAPKAPVRPVIDEYFGQKIVDPYRWMEDDKNPEFLTWMKAQAAYARANLDALPGYSALLQRCRQIQTGDVRVQQIVRSGNRYVYVKLNPGENLPKLYVRDGLSGHERLLYDPAKESTDEKHVAVGDFHLSDDGRFASYIVMRGGGEFGDLRVVNLDTGRNLPDVIPNTRGSGGSWAPDGKSLLYIHFQNLDPSVPAIERVQKTATFIHRFGTPASADKAVFGYGADPRVPVAPVDLGFADFKKGSSYVAASVNTGVSPESEYYLAKAADLASGAPFWRRIASRADKVNEIEVHGGDLYLLSFKDAPRYQILKTSALNPDLAHAQVVVPASDAVIEDIGAARDGLYFTTLEGGPYHIYRLDYVTNRREEVPLPANTSGSFVAPDLTQDGILVRLSSWTRAPAVYNWDPLSQKLANTGIQPPSQLESPMSAIEVTTAKVPSHDGTLVPLFIFSKKGVPRNGENPMLLTGYGAYGAVTTSPYFLMRWLPWFEKGGLLAMAGVRGGGEYGEDWHLAGKLATKPNTWKDFIACAEYLVSQRYTSPAHLGAEGGSAGGVLIGNTLTERPDLFKALIMSVPMTDTLRSEATANGVFNIAEFGTVKTEEGFKALLAMDAYQKVKGGTAYPAVLFRGGMNDPRVNPFFSGKMGARLQAATSSANPILLDFWEDTGHGFGNSQEQWSKDSADRYAFLLAQLSK